MSSHIGTLSNSLPIVICNLALWPHTRARENSDQICGSDEGETFLFAMCALVCALQCPCAISKAFNALNVIHNLARCGVSIRSRPIISLFSCLDNDSMATRNCVMDIVILNTTGYFRNRKLPGQAGRNNNVAIRFLIFLSN